MPRRLTEKSFTTATRAALKPMRLYTGTELAYRRKDGVNIVPIGCLKD